MTVSFSFSPLDYKTKNRTLDSAELSMLYTRNSFHDMSLALPILIMKIGDWIVKRMSCHIVIISQLKILYNVNKYREKGITSYKIHTIAEVKMK